MIEFNKAREADPTNVDSKSFPPHNFASQRLTCKDSPLAAGIIGKGTRHCTYATFSGRKQVRAKRKSTSNSSLLPNDESRALLAAKT